MSENANTSFPIAAIGASAGGIEAAKNFFEHIARDTGIAFLYIQHLSPDHISNLVEIMGKGCPLVVEAAVDGVEIQPDHVYVIVPNKELEVSHGVIRMYDRTNQLPHMPIDRCMRSLAESHREASIGILLSGSGNDGTVGMKAIKVLGGLTFAQDESAAFQGMSRGAIIEGCADFVLPPQEIAEELNRLSKEKELHKYINLDLEEGERIALDQTEISEVLAMIKKLTNVDFTHYKINTIRRRIIRRLLLRKLTNIKSYFEYIKENPSEIFGLYNDLLINVTSFFRDEEALLYLQKEILPTILNSKSSHSPLRIWIPGCSTGEEAYSMAMVLVELMSEHAWPVSIQIFATDLSEKAIGKARLGIYLENEVVNLSPVRLERFFQKTDGHYRVIKAIRDLCVFAPHNLLKDPPFSKIDIISCCNLLIYLEPALQKKVINIFHYALNEKGYLVLGKSETVGSFRNLFLPVDKKLKIYEKRDTVGKSIFEVTKDNDARNVTRLAYTKPVERNTSQSMNLEKVIDSIVLSEFAPPCVVINPEFEILQFRGSTRLFLEPAQGKASLNILKMVRPAIAIELRTAINQCLKAGEPVKKEGLQIKLGKDVHHVNLKVQSLQPLLHENLVMVIFEEVQVPSIAHKNSSTESSKIHQLENEIISVREEMRSLLEEQEAANEELQSANEEIVSSNEELQSINEELETSKEEIESTNEELMTINSELIVRNDQLAESQEYTDAVFFTIREAVLILTPELRVRSANPSFLRIFQAAQSEVEGLLLYEINQRQWNIPPLIEMLQTLNVNGESIVGKEISHDFGSTGQKHLVINARKVVQKTHRQQFILLAIEDITEHKQNQVLLAERELWFKRMTDNVPVMLWVAGPDKKITYLNRTWLEYTGTTMEAQLGLGWLDCVYKDDLAEVLEKYNTGFQSKEKFRVEYRLKNARNEYRWVIGSGTPAYDPVGKFLGYTGSVTEIHDERIMNHELEKRVKDRTAELEAANQSLEKSNKELEQFAYVASHDLQEPLRKIMTFSGRLEENYKNELPKAGQELIDKILLSSQRMRLLIDDLLNFSRLSKPVGQLVSTNLNQVLQDILQDFELRIKESGAKIQYDNLPVIDALPVQMQQLFYNLLSNALKFTRPSVTPDIRISGELATTDDLEKHQLPNAPFIKIVFADNGVGFNQDFADQAFEIFHRLHKEKYSGTGIGLALCRKIVEQHHGIIEVFSEEDKGTNFNIYLPVRQG